jgi:hypothetical protein
MGRSIFIFFYLPPKKKEGSLRRALFFSLQILAFVVSLLGSFFFSALAPGGFRVFFKCALNSLLEGLHGKSLVIFICTVLCKVSRMAGGRGVIFNHPLFSIVSVDISR